MTRIVEILGQLSERLGVPVLTTEYEIALTLLDQPDLTADQLIDSSSLSRAGFFNTIDRLKMWGVVVCNPGDADRRCRHYRLEDGVARLIMSMAEKYRARHEATYDPSDFQTYLSGEIEARKSQIKLDHMSTEFQIVIFLLAMPGATNTDLKELIDSSGTKFNRILSDLCDKGLVYFVRDEADKRRKRYYVSEPVADIMKEFHGEVFAWLDARRAH